MPYEWDRQDQGAPEKSGAFSFAAGAPPMAALHLWPYRSLPRRGFVFFIGVTFALLSVPLIAVVGSPVLWGLLPFVMGALGLMWWLLERNYRDGEMIEEFRLWSDRVELTRHEPRGKPRHWEANPYWVRVEMHATGGPVENYITLKGAGREVEIGAFLSADERQTLFGELQQALSRVR